MIKSAPRRYGWLLAFYGLFPGRATAYISRPSPRSEGPGLPSPKISRSLDLGLSPIKLDAKTLPLEIPALGPNAAGAPRDIPAIEVADFQKLTQPENDPRTFEQAAAAAAQAFDRSSVPAPDFSASAPAPGAPAPSSSRLARLFGFGRQKAPSLSLEEESARTSLLMVYREIKQGSLQNALDHLEELFTGAAARAWYRYNPQFAGYWRQAMGYYSHIEETLKADHARARRRGKDPVLLAQAQGAAAQGALLGHAYAPSRIQDCGSPQCAYFALHNAISASAGFAQPTEVKDLIAFARAHLNRPGQLADVGDGLSSRSLQELAELLGLRLAPRGPPAGEDELLALIRTGGEVMMGLRTFHGRCAYADAEREIHGHRYKLLHHEAFLLGAFPSATLNRWVYMVQDSGSGTTDFYTWDEFKNLAQELHILSPSEPVKIAHEKNTVSGGPYRPGVVRLQPAQEPGHAGSH